MAIFTELNDLLEETKRDIHFFMKMLVPILESAENEHDRLYWHHIYEEEEQHIDRLTELLPKVKVFIDNDALQSSSNPQFVSMLQDVSLEKFGIHNFEEHLDLAMFQFKDEEDLAKLKELLERTERNYDSIKDLLQQLNDQFNNLAMRASSTPTDEKEHVPDEHKRIENKTNIETITSKKERRLTVGSLK